MRTEEAILRHARDLYLEHGLSGLSMRAVAARAGITATAIYRHYESKEELVAALCRTGFEHFAQYLARGLKGKTPRERLDLTSDGYFDFAIDHAGYYRIMFMTPGDHLGFAELGKRVQEDAHPTFLFLVDRVRECMAEGELAEGDPYAAALTLWAHCHGLCSLWLTQALERHFGRADLFREFYRASMKTLADGLR